MRNRRYLRLFSIPLLFSLLFLGGCDLVLLNPKGYIGHEIKTLIITSVCLMLLVVIPAIFMTLYFAFKYREGNNAKYSPNWEHSNKVEVVIWGVPIIIIVILAVLTYHYTHKLEPSNPIPVSVSKKEPITIQVIALRWKWLFVYPEQGIATVNQVVFPEKTPVRFEITSDTAITSFIIPQLGSQIYAMAGMETKLHLIADGPGVYQGTAANFIGYGYSYMLFKAVSLSQENFNTWVADVKNGTAKNLVDGKAVETMELNPKTFATLRKERNKDFFYPVTFYNVASQYASKNAEGEPQDGLFEQTLETFIPAPDHITKQEVSEHSHAVGGGK